MGAELNQQPGPAAGHGRLQRGIYLLPSLFTVGTLVCGYIAVLSTLQAIAIADSIYSRTPFDVAARAIGWAIVFDGLDGRIARMTNASSNFGREFDSLADVITFGLAPAFLAFAWGVRPVVAGFMSDELMRLGWIVTFAYVICGAARLARFNIEKGATGDRRYFIGLPIPGAAGVIAAVVHFYQSPITETFYGLAWLSTVAALAFLMVSRIRYFSFKTLDLRRRRPYVTIILIGSIVGGIFAFSQPVLLLMATVYMFSGPLGWLAGRLRPQPPAPRGRGVEGSHGPETHPA
jgi:CDP-diacylglycerol---serine O-phosphatidyltransferase